MIEDINKTIVSTYVDAKTMMDYIFGYCPCCRYEQFDKWYKERTAFFVKRGMFVMENLLFDDVTNKPLRYCFMFDFLDKDLAKFTIYNYYTQEKVCDFTYDATKSTDVSCPKIVMEHYDKQKWFRLGGVFMNPALSDRLGIMWSELNKASRGKKRSVYARMEKETKHKVEYTIREFMCAHTVFFTYSSMFYFSREKPLEIENPYVEEQTATATEEAPATISVKTKTKYLYSGYIDLTKTKVYRANITERMEDEKRNYIRHIEKWSVKGHHRTINGKTIWIDEHVRGSGELEKRIYGTIPEKELGLIPKIFEVETIKKTVAREIAQETKAVTVEVASPKALEITQETKAVTVEVVVASQKRNIFIRFIQYIKALWQTLKTQ